MRKASFSSVEKFAKQQQNLTLQGGTIMGQPDQVENLGNTQIPFDVFMQYLQEQAQSDFQ